MKYKIISLTASLFFSFIGVLALADNVYLAPVSDLESAEMKPASPPISNGSSTGEFTRNVNIASGFDGTESTLPGNRINRNGVASTCAGKAFPGTFTPAGNLYDTYSLRNNGPERCVTVNFDTGTCGVAAHAVAYVGAFNPTDLSQNYLGDVGSSVTQPFSFIAPANSNIVIVINTNFGPTICNYSFSSVELDQLAPSLFSIPTLQEWGILLMALLLGSLVWRQAYFRTRQ